MAKRLKTKFYLTISTVPKGSTWCPGTVYRVTAQRIDFMLFKPVTVKFQGRLRRARWALSLGSRAEFERAIKDGYAILIHGGADTRKGAVKVMECGAGRPHQDNANASATAAGNGGRRMKIGDRVKYTPCCFASQVPSTHAGTVRQRHPQIGYTYYRVEWDDGAQSWCHESDLTDTRRRRYPRGRGENDGFRRGPDSPG